MAEIIIFMNKSHDLNKKALFSSIKRIAINAFLSIISKFTLTRLTRQKISFVLYNSLITKKKNNTLEREIV